MKWIEEVKESRCRSCGSLIALNQDFCDKECKDIYLEQHTARGIKKRKKHLLDEEDRRKIVDHFRRKGIKLPAFVLNNQKLMHRERPHHGPIAVVPLDERIKLIERVMEKQKNARRRNPGKNALFAYRSTLPRSRS